MKPHLTLLLFFFCTVLFAQQLEDDEARFFAQALHDNDVLSNAGLEKLNLEIRNQVFGRNSNILTEKSPLESGPAQPSSIIGFLFNAYYKEFAFRTAKVEVGELAHTMFGSPPPKSLTLEQENALLSTARKRFGNHEGPKIETALGQNVFVDDILPPFFMMFARPAPTINMLENKRIVPVYEPLISPSRSVLGRDILYVLDLLEELGISLPGDRNKTEIDSIEARFAAAHQILNSVGKSVADREMAPERRAKNTAFIHQCVSFGLFDQATADNFLANKEVMEQAQKLPFFKAFTRSTSQTTLGFRPNYQTGIPKLMAGLRDLDPAFQNAELSYKFTPTKKAPASRYEDGDNLTLTLTAGGKTWTKTYREGRSYEGNTEPYFSLNQRVLGLLTKYLNETGNPKMLFTILNRTDTKGPEGLKNRGKYILMLLTDEEASAIIQWSLADRISGPMRYLRLSL